MTTITDAPTDVPATPGPLAIKSQSRRCAPAHGPPHQCADQRRAQIREIWTPALQRLANGAATPIRR